MNFNWIYNKFRKSIQPKKILIISLSAVMIFSMALTMSGCNTNSNNPSGNSNGAGNSGTSGTENIFGSNTSNNVVSSENTTGELLTLNADDMFTDRDKKNEYDISKATQITLTDESITLSEEGCYILSGSLADGQIIIDAADTTKIQLVLNGVTIHSSDSAAIFIKEADKVFLTLADGTTNELTNGGTFAESEYNIDSVIFSKADLTLNGTGILNISSAGGHGIVSKDDLMITSGTYNITAGSSAISGKDSVRIADGTFTLNAQKDGIHSENTDDTEKGFIYIADGTFDITAASDGLDASSTIQVEGGNFQLKTDDDALHADSYLWIRNGVIDALNCYEGLEAQSITVDDGTINITASDDGMNAAGGNDGSGFGPGGGQMNPMSGRNPFEGNEMQGGRMPDKEFSPDEMPDAEFPSGEVPSGEVPSGEVPSGERPSGEMPSGNAPLDEMPSGNAPFSEMPSGKMPFNEMPSGEVPFSENSSVEMERFSGNSTYGITINGGKIMINAKGDGIDSNGSFTVTGGEVYVEGPENSGNGALDYATDAVITGGTFVAFGYSGMAQNFGSTSTQCAMLVTLSSTVSADNTVTLSDASGNSILAYTPKKSFNSVLISTPDIKTGETYTLTAGSETISVEMTDTIYGSGMGAMGGMGGFGGRGRH